MRRLLSVMIPLLLITGCSKYSTFSDQDCTEVNGEDRREFGNMLTSCERLVSQSDRRQCRTATIRAYCRSFIYVLNTETGAIRTIEKGLIVGSNDSEKRPETRD